MLFNIIQGMHKRRISAGNDFRALVRLSLRQNERLPRAHLEKNDTFDFSAKHVLNLQINLQIVLTTTEKVEEDSFKGRNTQFYNKIRFLQFKFKFCMCYV